MDDLRVALVGAGYWGKNLVRNFQQLGVLECVCDEREEALAEVRANWHVATTTCLEDALADSRIQAVVIAVPAAQHYELVKKCL